ncbi:hypothetical protein AGR7B_pAt0057 [Agrobacterium deltaense RV3]|nr:hypothetical protein AGR7B_pAt0057 [Agrobacterium deltaense RV3]
MCINMLKRKLVQIWQLSNEKLPNSRPSNGEISLLTQKYLALNMYAGTFSAWLREKSLVSIGRPLLRSLPPLR